MNPHLPGVRRFMRRAISATFTALCLGSAGLATAQLAEYEGFQYTGSGIVGQAGGTGWANAWANTNGNAVLSDDNVSLIPPSSVTNIPIGGRLTFTGQGVVERGLGATPNLANEGIYYFSALVKYQGSFKFEFWDSSVNARWRIGATNDGQSGLVGIATDIKTGGIFPPNETVLVVAKMISHATGNDQVLMNVYRASDVIPAAEPGVWQASNASASGVTLTRLRIQNLMDLPLEVDEIRIGTTWGSVAGASASGPPIVTRQPVSTSAYQGSDVQFLVEATGAFPLQFQWYRNGSPILNATNATLLVTNVQASGQYVAQVSNSVSTTNSNPAQLNVILFTNVNVGLQALWHMDETSGLVAHDATTNHFDGALINFTNVDNSQWISSDYNGALSFSGSNYVEVADRPAIGANLVNRFSVATWIRSRVTLTPNAAAYRMMEKENAFFLLQGDGTVGNGIGGVAVLVKKGGANFGLGVNQALNANTWYHVAATYDGANLNIYLDGVLMNTRAVAAPLDSTTLPLHIGADYMAATNGTRYLAGAMDEVGIWDRPLQPSEILVLAGNSGPPVILDQPQSQTRYVGGSATFSVRARGQQPMRYQWVHGTDEIRGADSNVLVVANIQLSDAGQYYCRISNDLGQTNSATATLTVLPVTSITDASEAIWKFDETSGLTAADTSGRGRDGQLQGYADTTSQWVPGKINNGLTFDGQSNRVVAVNSENLNLGSDASFAFWLRPTSYGTLQNAGTFLLNTGRVLRKGSLTSSQIDIETVDDPGSVRATLRVNGVPAPQQNILQLNVWQHFVVVFSGGKMSIYKNGFLVGDPVNANLGSANTNPVVLGSQSDTLAVTNMYNGSMDEVGIWTRVLSETEILTLAQRDVSGAPVIVRAPESAARYEGSSVTFSVDATGKRPLTYEWRHDGNPIPNSNSNRLALTNLTLADAGAYTVFVQNNVGSQLSTPPATLIVQQISNVTSGLVAYWNFDETSGTVFHDASGRGHNATLQGGTIAPTLGTVSNAFDFNGSTEFAIVPHAPDLSMDGQGTISAWIYPHSVTAIGDRPRIVRKDINFDFNILGPAASLRVYGLNKVEYAAPNNSVTSNVWQHVVVVIKDGTIQFYKDGRPLAQPIAGLLGPAVTNDLIIGNFGPDLSINRLFNGVMDELGIWDRALTPEEIDGIYQNGLLNRPLNAPFTPFKVLAIGPTNGNQMRILYSSPFTGRQHAIQVKNQLSDVTWATQSGVTFNDLGNSRTEALFALPTTMGFYRVAALPAADIFFEDFETGGPNWTHGGTHDTWQVGTPTNPNGPSAAYSGVNVYGTGLSGNVTGGTDSYLRSPSINLASVTRATLTFREWRSVDPDVTFHWTYVNVLDGGTHSIIQQIIPRTAGATTGYELRSVPLPAEVLNRNVILEFVISTDSFPPEGVPGWFIDDVRISPE